jgi:hypothetical protein
MSLNLAVGGGDHAINGDKISDFLDESSGDIKLESYEIY